jgi:hypothetical protein
MALATEADATQIAFQLGADISKVKLPADHIGQEARTLLRRPSK